MAAKGRSTGALARRPKPPGPGTPAASHSGLCRNGAVPAGPTVRRREAPPAVGRSPQIAKSARRPEKYAHRGSCGASLKTPRAGRRRLRRTCGLYRAAALAEVAAPPWCRKAPRPVGRWRPRRSARPRKGAGEMKSKRRTPGALAKIPGRVSVGFRQPTRRMTLPSVGGARDFSRRCPFPALSLRTNGAINDVRAGRLRLPCA